MCAEVTRPEGAMVVAILSLARLRCGSRRIASSTQAWSAGLCSSIFLNTCSEVSPGTGAGPGGGVARAGAGACVGLAGGSAAAALPASAGGAASPSPASGRASTVLSFGPSAVQRMAAATASARSTTNTPKGPRLCRGAALLRQLLARPARQVGRGLVNGRRLPWREEVAGDVVVVQAVVGRGESGGLWRIVRGSLRLRRLGLWGRRRRRSRARGRRRG